MCLFIAGVCLFIADVLVEERVLVLRWSQILLLPQRGLPVRFFGLFKYFRRSFLLIVLVLVIREDSLLICVSSLRS